MTVDHLRGPSPDVRAAFGAVGDATPLPGGRGRSWVAGNVVLKPLDLLPAELDWLAAASTSMPSGVGLRVGFPLTSKFGRLIEEGWIAVPKLPGHPNARNWAEIADVARTFASAFSGQKRPAFIDARMHAWARADRLAWDELQRVDVSRQAPHLEALAAAKRPVQDVAQIVHGDLIENVLFSHGRPAAVIDLTIYWRPVEYSVAIIALDAVCFHGAPLGVFETLGVSRSYPQLLIRAAIFREATDWFNELPDDHFAVYDAAIERILALAEQRDS